MESKVKAIVIKMLENLGLLFSDNTFSLFENVDSIHFTPPHKKSFDAVSVAINSILITPMQKSFLP